MINVGVSATETWKKEAQRGRRLKRPAKDKRILLGALGNLARKAIEAQERCRGGLRCGS